MPAKDHAAYGEELERCRVTLDYVEKTLEATLRKKEKLDKDVEWTKKHLSSESSQDYVSLLINTQIQDSMTLKLRNLFSARSTPYFARVDFTEGETGRYEKLYIGKMSLMREEDQEVIIVDWRAPIANLYYEGRLGKASYICPEGRLEGELSLKRQFSIHDGVLREIFDIDITTNDEFLQAYLGANAENRLKEIVSTIQEEQNRIVRHDMWLPLIVQGAAGSGKTTIALHRIAYLIYTYEKTFQPENFMILAPNKLFLNYISEVLPELGVERVLQTTFEDFAAQLLGKKLKFRDSNEKLTAFADHRTEGETRYRNELMKKASALKASFQFKEALDHYIRQVEKNYIPREDFTIASKVVMPYTEINRLFLEEYKNWPLHQRLNEIKKHMNSRMKQKKDAIINALHEQCDQNVGKLKLLVADPEERQRRIVEVMDRRDALVEKLESHAKKAVSEYIKKISKLDPFAYYREFFEDSGLYTAACEGMAEEEVLTFLKEHSLSVLKSGFLELEDLAPLIYLKYRIYGMEEKIPVKHIVIDEAQDFSVFQLFVLRKIIKDSSFTILGDLSQGIHSYRGIQDWEEVQRRVFDDRKSEILYLQQSYRTSVEIMEAANKVISRVKGFVPVEAKPVIRHGPPVSVMEMANLKLVAEDAAKRIHEYKQKGYKSIALICKTIDGCMELQKLLKGQGVLPDIITGKETEYKGELVIVPSYLAKGLEFDAVMITDASAENYREDDLDIKLLYVAMTRPLHELHIYHCGEKTHLLSGI